MKEAVDKYQGVNLYLKNLDDSIRDDNMRELFSEFGSITSCKLPAMKGKMVCGKPLYVAPAQCKEDRRARLQAQFSQMQPVAMAPTVGPRVPMYLPGAPGLGKQLFCGQAPPDLILLQILPRGRAYCYPPVRNIPDVLLPGVAGGILSPCDMRGLPM